MCHEEMVARANAIIKKGKTTKPEIIDDIGDAQNTLRLGLKVTPVLTLLPFKVANKWEMSINDYHAVLLLTFD